MTFDVKPFASLPYMSLIVPHLAFMINAGINQTFVTYYLTTVQAYTRIQKAINS